MAGHNYIVYILTNPAKTVLYTGVTNDLAGRLSQHYKQRGLKETFAGRNYCFNLLYWERHGFVQHAIEREKELKGWSRKKKIALIERFNP